MKQIKICKKCSGFDVKELESQLQGIEYEMKLGCLTKCKRKHPEFAEKVFGMINREFILCDSKQEFFEKARQ